MLRPRVTDRTPREYWRRNVRYVGWLLLAWFLASYGAGILFAGRLDAIRIPGTGFPLGFWFAQQGSMYVFVILIFVYVLLMNRLDRDFGVDEEKVRRARAAARAPGSARGGRGGPDHAPAGEARDPDRGDSE